ncbi:MAG: hypothetical protein ACRDEA_00575, partial [Microcystaceae cyanobacterium]
MANTYPSCPLGDGILEDLNKRKDQKVKYAPDYVNDLVGKMRQLLTNRAADATIYADELANRTAQRAAAQTLVDTVFAREAADIVNLEGVSVGRVEQFHAYWLGERAKLGGLSPDLTYSNAGEVLDDILTARNVAGGIIDIQTKMNGLHAVQEYWKLFKNSMSSKGINDAKTVNDIFRDSVEVGLIPKHNAGLNIGKNGRSFNMERYRAFRIDMYKKGFSSDEFDNLMDSAYKIGGSMDDVRIMVNKLGANVGEVEGLGYLPRMWTHDMKKWVDKARSLKEGSLFETADAAREWAFKESRSTYHYVPEDNLLVAYQLDIPVSQLNDM